MFLLRYGMSQTNSAIVANCSKRFFSFKKTLCFLNVHLLTIYSTTQQYILLSRNYLAYINNRYESCFLFLTIMSGTKLLMPSEVDIYILNVKLLKNLAILNFSTCHIRTVNVRVSWVVEFSTETKGNFLVMF